MMSIRIYKTVTSKLRSHRSTYVRYSSNIRSNIATINIGDRVLSFETGTLAKMADGCVVGSVDQTSVLATAVCKPKSVSIGFLPLTVDYRHKAAAAGRIPSNFLRRELGASDLEILTSRMIDRSVRPLFSKGFSHDVQLTCNVLAADGVNDPDVVAINSSSAALTLSDVPWNGPVAAVRLGFIAGNCVVNPTRRQLQNSTLNCVLSAASNGRIIMLDGFANQLPVSDFLTCIDMGLKETEKIIKELLNLKSSCGKEKRSTLEKLFVPEKQYIDAVLTFAEAQLKDIYSNAEHTKLSRDAAVNELKKEVLIKLKESYISSSTMPEPGILEEAFTMVCKHVFRQLMFETGRRTDGRNLKQLRPISCKVNLFAPLHGSAVFQRGHTQVLCTVTLDSLESSFRNDAISVLMGADKEKLFMLNYQFPPYANNELGSGKPGRRELGHGALAEKALKNLMPKDFPFATRLSCEVLESNGSSSMASVCAGSLALMDAGVQIVAPAAGLAIGLLTLVNPDDPTKVDDYRLLTDITGLEDFMGDMDFKTAGTDAGLTAVQLDVKLPSGLSFEMLTESLKQADIARAEVLQIMATDGLKQPRPSMKDNGPATEQLIVPVNKRSKLIGLGGYNLKMIESETGVQVTQVDQQTYKIFGTNRNALAEAKEMIEKFLSAKEKESELEFGAVYSTKIVEILSHGIKVTVSPDSTPIFIHNSQLDQRKVDHASVLGLKVGDDILVKYFGRDPGSGSIRLSRKVLQTVSNPVKKDLFQDRQTSSPWVNKSGG